MNKPNPNEKIDFTFTNEKPIESITEDEKGLNINNYAEYLAKNIENYFKYNQDSITIGLMGEWGSGKTSILNLTENFLENTDVKVMKFNPWIYSSYNQLIEQFFDELIKQFYSEKNYTLGNNIREYWLKINKSDLAKKTFIHLIASKNNTIANILNDLFKYDSKEKSLEKLKNDINTKLLGHKIVCIIDDLDRVSTTEIYEMFKLIKIMADFNNIIYILSFDKKIIAKSLDDEYIDGEKYIEKIINISLDVPLATDLELKNILINGLTTLSKKHDIELDEDRLNNILDEWDYETKKRYGILYFFKTIRDIKRFNNLLEFNIELIKNEVNFEDFIAITAIQIFKPEIYEKIKYNESLLVKYPISKNEYSSNPEIAKTEQQEFENIIEDNDNLNHILKTLFPKMSFIYNTRFISDYSSTYDEKLLICHPDHFKTYFKLNPIVKTITEEEISIILDYINYKKEQEILEAFKNLNEKDKLDKFFEVLNNRANKIKEPEFFLNLIFSLDKKFNEEIFNKNRHVLKEICLMLIIKINSKNRFEILNKEYYNMNHLNFLFELFIHIKNHNNLSGLKNEVILTETELNELENIIKDKYILMLKKHLNYITYNIINVFKLGRDLKLENEFRNAIDNLISTKEGLLQFLKSYMYPDMNRFLESEISDASHFSNMETIKEKIDENYDEIKDVFEVKKFLKEYEMWKTDNLVS